MTFYNYFNKEKDLIEKNKLVIILGSGFHKEAYSINRVKKDKPVLACWQSLLKRLGSKCKLHSPIINFEELIKDETNNQRKKNASAIEKDILKRAGEIILDEQVIASKIRRYAELSKIFHSKYVSDVISLNFDFLPEYLLNRKVSFKKKDILNLNTFYHSTNDIRFWYPHGIAAKSDTIMLSLRNYYTGLQNIESMRSEYKQNELKSLKDRSSITWFSQFMEKPLLILGCLRQAQAPLTSNLQLPHPPHPSRSRLLY